MKLCEYLTCFCCAGLMILTGCTADNGQAEASNTAANTANTNIATVQPASSNTLENTSTPVKPTAAYTSREPQYTFNPATPAPTATLVPTSASDSFVPAIKGAEFLRPSDEEIAELKKVYRKTFEGLEQNKRMRLLDVIVSFNNACVGYDFADYVFRDYDWSQGIPSIEDVRAYMSEDTNYDRVYTVPIYSKDYKLIACMEYSYRASGVTSSSIRFAEDDYLDYWEEMYYCLALPMHTQAYYVYMRIKTSHYLGDIQDMMLISEGSWNYSYCLVQTDKGSYVYNRPYEDEFAINVSSPTRFGHLYTNENQFRWLYKSQLDKPRFSDGGAV